MKRHLKKHSNSDKVYIIKINYLILLYRYFVLFTSVQDIE